MMVSKQILKLIETADRDRTAKLDLSRKKLTELPAALWEINSIVELDLSNNQLATIPVEISKLTNLAYLNLDRNLITDLSILQSLPQLQIVRYLDVSLPRGCWGEIETSMVELANQKSPQVGSILIAIDECKRTQATKLDRSSCKLRILPQSIGELTDLTQLDLSYNYIEILPDSIGNLSKLTNFNLKSNRLTKLPESIGNLTNLKVFNIHRNPLIELPESIGNLTKITQLRPCKGSAASSDLQRLPESIGKLTNLTQLALQGCQLTELPESIGNLTKLSQLYLNYNRLTALPESIAKLQNLTKLNLDGNPLSDLSILNSLPKLKEVTFLAYNLDRRYWTKFSEWKSIWITDEECIDVRRAIVEHLGIDRIFNDLAKISTPFMLNFMGCLPPEALTKIGKLKNLTELRVHGNELRKLSNEISELTNLKTLNIACNQLQSLPDNIANLSHLQELYASNNQLDLISFPLSDLVNIEKIWLSNNQISQLPADIGRLINLNTLDLSDNCLQYLPDSIGNCQNLEHLDLSRNQLIELPESFGNLTELKYLQLQGNSLQKLPNSMKNMHQLIDLNLNQNPLTDLSMLQHLPALKKVWLLGARLPHRYWIEFGEWKAEWLFDETNSAIRRLLIEQLGYEKICAELEAIEIDTWQEYTLLKIDNIQSVYEGWQEVGKEAMVLLRMTCPSTSHTHTLRVPPEMTSAEVAIVWVNHGIHPSQFSVQT
jgi:leucine-rich repeat protein SHOC2